MGGVDSDLLDYMMGHVLPYGGAYDRWTEEDLKKEYSQAENYLALRPVATVTKEDIREEILRALLGKLMKEDFRGLRTHVSMID